MTFGGKTGQNRPVRSVEAWNQQAMPMLPPEVEGPNFGHLFIEMGNLDWLTYDGQNYLDDGSGDGRGANHLFANIKFWGDRSKGIYLKMANGMSSKKGETITNKFRYDIKCPEKTFEKYLDDMGVLVVDFYDSERSQTIGTSKIMMKLFIKSQFPITLTGNQNVKIGQFNLSVVSSFSNAGSANANQQMKSNQRQQVSLDDSFEENEKLAKQMTKQDKNKKIIEGAFTDDRIPSSYQPKRGDSTYKKQDFDFEIDEKPTRERPQRGPSSKKQAEKENQRNIINIDENEDTFSNQNEFAKIFERGEKLRQQMTQALDSDNAWQILHGQHEVPKRYVPPFLKEEVKKPHDDEELDNIYEMEIEGHNLRESQEPKTQGQIGQQEGRSTLERQETAHIRDMKFIRIKIHSLRVEDEGLLHSLIDETFSIFVDVPLPDIYQKKITYQSIKLSDYDIVSFNEFVFNSLSLYNFKIDEETFNQLVNSELKVGIQGKQVQGSIQMIKLMLSKTYKIQVSIPLEQTVIVEEQKQRHQSKGRQDQSKGKKTTGKQDQKKPQQEEAKQVSSFTKQVGHLTLELQLQQGDTDEELAKDYQIKLQKLQEIKAKEEAERQAELQKCMKFSQNQEPVFAQLYLNINGIRNMCLNPDGTLNKAIHEESFNQRLGLQSERDEQKNDGAMNPLANKQEGPKRNLFVQYKAFPSLDKLKTNTVWQEHAPKFSYRSQFPVIMNPETMQRLQNFTFVLEVWDAVSPAKEELVGFVKIPLASFCYSMKTSDDQIFSLNFLADQHCLYPMMVTDGYLPIYNPRLGLNIGELQVTLALGTAIQINRQIQKEQEQEKQLLEMTFKTHMLEMIKAKQEEEAKLKLQIEAQQQQIQKERARTPTPERSVTPTKSQDGKFNFQEGLLSGFNSLIPNSPDKGNLLQNMMGNYLRQSLNISLQSRDVDRRNMTYLNCMIKLFEEARTLEISELNGDDIFKDCYKNFDGSVKKDDFLYALLNKEGFTFTRSEISNLQNLMLNITKVDNGNINIDELQFSYKQYLGYYESFQEPIVELFQLFKRNIDKKIEDANEQESLITKIEERAIESKIPVNDLKDVLDSYGILLRDNVYDQLSSYFDLDRNCQIYIPSFCQYLRTQSIMNLNFLKVSPSILQSRINNFIKEQTLINPNYLSILENELKQELFKELGKTGPVEEIPEDILLQERINAKLFQVKLRQQGTVISLWEVFTFFEYLNINYQKLYFEPQRYHHIMFPVLYKFICGQDYEARVREEIKKKQEADQQVKASTESVFALAQDLNKKKIGNDSEEGIYSSKSEVVSDEESEEVVIEKDGKKKKDDKSKRKTDDKKREMTFLPNKSDDADQSNISKPISPEVEENRTYKKVKHVFEIKVKELKNIPILDKLIKDINNDKTALSTLAHKKSKVQKDYIQNVAVKYAFPLDDDEIFQSDYIQRNSESLTENNQYDYKVSINTVHNYIMNKDETIAKLLKSHSNTNEQLFNISIAIYDNNKEFIIGNAQLPIEDLIDLTSHYDQSRQEKQTLSRVLFVYGTTFSQRENCIIGKMQLEINYSQEKQYISIQDSALNAINDEFDKEEDLQSCFLHKETYIKRKIPLNAVINVSIDSIHNLKESIENIEHYAKIQQSALRETQDQAAKSSKLTSMTSQSKKNQIAMSKDTLDRRRILTQIFKNGLNLTVIGSIFDEESDLVKRFPTSKHTCKLLYNTLNPIFNEAFEVSLQMDSKIFEYIKNKKARFEIRHYILPQKSTGLGVSQLQQFTQDQRDQMVSDRSQISDDDREVMENSDYIVIGTVTVPLLHLITKNNGIDGDFVIFDEYKQQMGALKLKIQLNHHNQQRPLYSQDTQNQAKARVDKGATNMRTTMIDRSARFNQTFLRGHGTMESDHKFLLGINFVELVFKNRDQLLYQAQLSQTLKQGCYLYLKFKLNGQNFQTKFLPQSNVKDSRFLKMLKIDTFDIKKTVFIELDFLRHDEIENVFNKPLEVQLWFRKEAPNKFQQPQEEIQLGSFMIELNELTKIRNKRVKDMNDVNQFQSYEGYFSLYNYENNELLPDRLGCKLMIFKKDYDTELADAEVLFHNLTQIEHQIMTTLDPQFKGYVDLDDLLHVVQTSLQDPYLSLIRSLIEKLEYKNQDKVYYSPLFGTLPPFFKYIRRFDSFGVVDKFNQELSALDTHGSGFIPLPIFRSVLEHELKIKEKIVLDFIQAMRETDANQQLQTLDVNIVTHSYKNHLDYVTLLRKIAFYFELKQNERLTTTESIPPETARQQEGELATLIINIESGLRFKNPHNEIQPPTCFVKVNFPFSGAIPHQLQTQAIQESFYPAWHLIGQQVKVPITQENIKLVQTQPLEFEVFHQSIGMNSTVANTLIGVAYVDLSQMTFIEGKYQISGYFHVLRKEKFADGKSLTLTDYSLINQDSLGQIKLSVTTFTNLKQPSYFTSIAGVIPNQFAMSFARESLKTDQKQNVFRASMEHKLNESFHQTDHELNLQHEDELKMKHSLNMSALDELLNTWKKDKLQKEDKDQVYPNYQEDMRKTRGHSQSYQLISELQKQPQVQNSQPPSNMKPTVNVIEQESDFDREELKNEEENVFEKNQRPSPLKQQEPIQDDMMQTFNQNQNFGFQRNLSPQFNDNIDDIVPIKETVNQGPTNDDSMRITNILQLNKEEDAQGEQPIQDTVRSQPLTEQKSKRSRFDLEEDEEYDAAEMARIQRIISNSTKKQ